MNSIQWWNNVKNDEVLLADWLIKQYRGEVTAASRIRILVLSKAKTEEQKNTLKLIAKQEEIHAGWIFDLLNSRNLVAKASINNAEGRYWSKTLPLAETSFENAVAVGAHAEAMRLERIKVIANDYLAPKDIQDTFKKILNDEIFHEKAFREMATKESLEKTSGSHNLGMELLGLTD